MSNNRPTAHRNIGHVRGSGQMPTLGNDIRPQHAPLAPPPPPPSLEQRLEYLEVSCSRLGNVVSRIGIIADRLATVPGDPNVPLEAPKPGDLTGRTAVAYEYVERQVTQLEYLAQRLHEALFSDNRAQAGAG